MAIPIRAGDIFDALTAVRGSITDLPIEIVSEDLNPETGLTVIGVQVNARGLVLTVDGLDNYARGRCDCE